MWLQHGPFLVRTLFWAADSSFSLYPRVVRKAGASCLVASYKDTNPTCEGSILITQGPSS